MEVSSTTSSFCPLPALRHDARTHPAAHTSPQGQGRTQRRLRAVQRAQRPDVRQLGGRESLPDRVGGDGGRHPHPRHHRPAGGQVVTELEQAALLPLPAERFPFFQEAERIVNRDGHVEAAKRTTRRRRSSWGARSGFAGTGTSSASLIASSGRSASMPNANRVASPRLPSTRWPGGKRDYTTLTEERAESKRRPHKELYTHRQRDTERLWNLRRHVRGDAK